MSNSTNEHDFYIDPRLMTGLVQKYKDKLKKQHLYLFIGIVVILLLSVVILFSLHKKNQYGEYISQKIDRNIDTILIETAKSKYYLDKLVEGKGSFEEILTLNQSTLQLKEVYGDTKEILNTAMNTVAPDKLYRVTIQLEEFLANLLKTNPSLEIKFTPEKQQQLVAYQGFYNDILLTQGELILEKSLTPVENNLSLLELTGENWTALQNQYKEKYTKFYTFSLEKTRWLDLFIKGETIVVKHNLLA